MQTYHFVMCHKTYPLPYVGPKASMFGSVDITAETEVDAVQEFIAKHQPADCGIRQVYWYIESDYEIEKFRGQR